MYIFILAAVILFQYTYTETGNGRSIFLSVQTAKDKWEAIGLGLGLRPETLQRIQHENKGQANQCLYAVISAWLHHKDGVMTSSWRSLLRALRSPKVGEGDLADKLMSERSKVYTSTH